MRPPPSVALVFSLIALAGRVQALQPQERGVDDIISAIRGTVTITNVNLVQQTITVVQSRSPDGQLGFGGIASEITLMPSPTGHHFHTPLGSGRTTSSFRKVPKVSTTTSAINPSATTGTRARNMELAMFYNSQFSLLSNSSSCEPDSITATVCLDSRIIAVCDPDTKELKASFRCPDALTCLSLPLETRPGVTIGCDKIDDAAAMMNVDTTSLESVLAGVDVIRDHPILVAGAGSGGAKKVGLHPSNITRPPLDDGILVVTATRTVFETVAPW